VTLVSLYIRCRRPLKSIFRNRFDGTFIFGQPKSLCGAARKSSCFPVPRDVVDDVEQISPPAWFHSTIWYLCTITLHISRISMVQLPNSSTQLLLIQDVSADCRSHKSDHVFSRVGNGTVGKVANIEICETDHEAGISDVERLHVIG